MKTKLRFWTQGAPRDLSFVSRADAEVVMAMLNETGMGMDFDICDVHALNGVTLGDNTMEAVKDIVRSNRKIAAIKIIREITGASLKESKDFVDAL